MQWWYLVDQEKTKRQPHIRNPWNECFLRRRSSLESECLSSQITENNEGCEIFSEFNLFESGCREFKNFYCSIEIDWTNERSDVKLPNKRQININKASHGGFISNHLWQFSGAHDCLFYFSYPFHRCACTSISRGWSTLRNGQNLVIDLSSYY